MKRQIGAAALSCVALVCAEDSAYAAQPPDVVASDASLNTAMGSFALFSNNSACWPRQSATKRRSRR